MKMTDVSFYSNTAGSLSSIASCMILKNVSGGPEEQNTSQFSAETNCKRE